MTLSCTSTDIIRALKVTRSKQVQIAVPLVYVTFRKLRDKKSKSFGQTVHVVDSLDYQGDGDDFISLKRRSHANIKYIVIANIVNIDSVQWSLCL